MPMPALYLVLRTIKAAISFLLVAPLMVIALSAAGASLGSGAAWAQERPNSQGADDVLRAASGFRARLKALEKKAASFRPDGVPVRAKAATSGAKPMPATREHILLGRQISAHKAAIRELHARVNALEKEARGHEMGHNLDMPPAMAAKKKTGRSAGERVNNPSFGVGLSKKSQALERDIAALEREARAIYKKPGRLK